MVAELSLATAAPWKVTAPMSVARLANNGIAVRMFISSIYVVLCDPTILGLPRRNHPAKGGVRLEIDPVVHGFITRTLPKSQWTHFAHLHVGLWHALEYPDGRALDLLRERIRAYNEATGVANTDHSGYHETITRFYLHVIRAFVRSVDGSRPFSELAQELVDRHGDRDLPLRHYTRERLFSVAARRSWLEPDLLPLAPDRAIRI